MTVTTPASDASAPPADLITGTIDGIEVSVPKGTLIIRAAEQLGIEVPRFCDHPLLAPVAACRACLVEIEGMPKPQPACAVPLGDQMVVKTHLTSEVANKAQRGVMEFLLINHPLDCPVCDKGGECPLQNQSMTNGQGETRFDGVKRTFPKPINVSSQILLDRERCVSCARCTRFADEIAGDPFIELLERGAKQQVGIAEDRPFDSYFSGNTVQICPVGALTSADYRFRARPFDLVSTPTTCEHCASGCSLRTDSRRSKVMRRLAWDDPEVNEEWNCDKGRFAFGYLSNDRITTPLVREDGELRAASWPEAIGIAAEKLLDSRGNAAVLTGGRLTNEDAYLYGKFARVALGTDDIDFRARASSPEEAELLTSTVAGAGLGVTYADLEAAPVVLLVGFEPEEESPMIFLRLRKAVAAGKTKVAAVSSWVSPGLLKLNAVTLSARPGAEGSLLDTLRTGDGSLSDAGRELAEQLSAPGAVILAGERLARHPGALSAAFSLAGETGASFAWVPRRAGERGSLDAGALAGLLPGGRPLTDSAARAEVAALWNVDEAELPAEAGRSFAQVIEDLTAEEAESDVAHSAPDTADDARDNGSVDNSEESADDEPTPFALVIGGVELTDLPDPNAVRAALEKADFVLSLETRLSEVAANADVVLPVAVDTERAGSYTDWEGRLREFVRVMPEATTMTDGRVLSMIADEMDHPIGYGDPASTARELSSLPEYTGARAAAPAVSAPIAGNPGSGAASLATWRQLLDLGVLQQEEGQLAGTRRRAVARVSAATASAIGVADGEPLAVSTSNGTITLPLVITDMPDNVVWVPMNSPQSTVYETLAAGAGDVVAISRGDADAS